jgi:hypothetical protein
MLDFELEKDLVDDKLQHRAHLAEYEGPVGPGGLCHGH